MLGDPEVITNLPPRVVKKNKTEFTCKVFSRFSTNIDSDNGNISAYAYVHLFACTLYSSDTDVCMHNNKCEKESKLLIILVFQGTKSKWLSQVLAVKKAQPSMCTKQFPLIPSKSLL